MYKVKVVTRIQRNELGSHYAWGTGMVASSSTFRLHLGGGVTRDLFRMLHAVLHGTKTLVYSKYTRAAATSTFDYNRHTLAPPLNSSANAAPTSVQSLMLALVGPSTKHTIDCLALCLSRGTEWIYP